LSFCLIASVHAIFKSVIVYPYQKASQALTPANGSVVIEAGMTVNGSVRVSGGPPSDGVTFYVTDPDNVTVLNYNDTTFTEFSFVASITGTYTAHFDNSLSKYLKGVELNYSVTMATPGGSQTLLYTILAITAILAAVIIVIAFILLRKHRQGQAKVARDT
jgi:hypothetical protein